jgi:hypothetical protein
MKLGMYIKVPEPISTAYSINPISLCAYMCIHPIVARQRLGKVYPFFRCYATTW